MCFLSRSAGVLTAIHHSIWAVWSAGEEGGSDRWISKPSPGWRLQQSPVCARGRRHVSTLELALWECKAAPQPSPRSPLGVSLTGSCATAWVCVSAERWTHSAVKAMFSARDAWSSSTSESLLVFWISFECLSHSKLINCQVDVSDIFFKLSGIQCSPLLVANHTHCATTVTVI